MRLIGGKPLVVPEAKPTPTSTWTKKGVFWYRDGTIVDPYNINVMGLRANGREISCLESYEYKATQHAVVIMAISLGYRQTGRGSAKKWGYVITVAHHRDTTLTTRCNIDQLGGKLPSLEKNACDLALALLASNIQTDPSFVLCDRDPISTKPSRGSKRPSVPLTVVVGVVVAACG